jgi:hypothetical protein
MRDLSEFFFSREAGLEPEEVRRKFKLTDLLEVRAEYH